MSCYIPPLLRQTAERQQHEQDEMVDYFSRIAKRIGALGAAALGFSYLITQAPVYHSPRFGAIPWGAHTLALSAITASMAWIVRNPLPNQSKPAGPDAEELRSLLSPQELLDLRSVVGPHSQRSYEYWTNVVTYVRAQGHAIYPLLPKLFGLFAQQAGKEFSIDASTFGQVFRSIYSEDTEKCAWQLFEFGLRQTETADYAKNKAECCSVLVAMVIDACGSAAHQKEFSNYFLGVLGGELERCGDRAATALSTIYTRWKLLQAPEASGKEEINLLVGIAKTMALRNGINAIIAQHEKETAAVLEEATQVYLWCEWHLKEKLGLVVSTKNIRSEHNYLPFNPLDTLCDWVDRTYLGILIELERFQSLLETSPVKPHWKKVAELSIDSADTQTVLLGALINSDLWTT